MTTRVEMSIAHNYVPDWDAWCGIREIIQNAYDAEIQFNAKMTVDWHNNKLRVENTDVTLPPESLLLGYTSKREQPKLRGHWGEGYKLGVLALIRAGHGVKIRSAGEVWTPVIADSKKYNAKVLAFDISSNNKEEKRVRVEIDNIDKDTWLKLKTRFLFLSEGVNSVKTSYGDLLTDDSQRGHIYVKGIYIQTDSRLAWGYNFPDADLDRDRKMLASYELGWRTRYVWQNALAVNPKFFNAFYKMAHEDSFDIQGMSESAACLPEAAVSSAIQAFKHEFGDNAIPVENLAESEEVGHLGKRGIIVNKTLSAILSVGMGNKSEIKESLRREVIKKYNWDELTEVQQTNLSENIKLLSRVRPEASLKFFDVVDFRSQLAGQIDMGTKQISIAYNQLDDKHELMATIVHEWAHSDGGLDGSVDHVRAIENLWRDIYKHISNNS